MRQVTSTYTQSDWTWNNPISAVEAFLEENEEFEAHEPGWPFNEGLLRKCVTYWPNAYLRRLQKMKSLT